MAKRFKGKVIRSGKTEKTVVVEVVRRRAHPLYGKVVGRKKWYHVHDEVGVEEGERVVFEETRPISKTKRWKIVGRTVAESKGGKAKERRGGKK